MGLVVGLGLGGGRSLGLGLGVRGRVGGGLGGKVGGGEGWLVCGSVGGLVVIEVDFGVDCRLDADGLAGLCWVRCCC